MFILAKGGQTRARLRFNTGPGGEIELPTNELDLSAEVHDEVRRATVRAEETDSVNAVFTSATITIEFS